MSNYVVNRIGFLCKDKNLAKDICQNHFGIVHPQTESGGYLIGDDWFIVQFNTFDDIYQIETDKSLNMPMIHYAYLANHDLESLVVYEEKLRQVFKMSFIPPAAINYENERSNAQIVWNVSLYPIHDKFSDLFSNMGKTLESEPNFELEVINGESEDFDQTPW